MDINDILKGVECECGRRHECQIRYVYIEKGAVERLSELCKEFENILLVADENTYSAAGEMVQSSLADKKCRRVIFPGSPLLIPNEEAISRVREALDGIELIIGIGSGVIQDLCKYVAHFAKLPYMVVATAPSMDGYASSGAAMILGGMKETVPAGVPYAIICDTDIIKNAPLEMIKAGYGDIVGKLSALNDWRLSHLVNGEYLCEYIYDTTLDMVNRTLEMSGGLMTRDERSIEALCEALIVVGIMMSFATTSRPASGSEHHLSHFFEITGIVSGKPYLPHGIDVAYSTVVTARLRESILSKVLPDRQYSMAREEYENKMNELYGPVGKSCVALQDKIGNYGKDRISVYKEREAEIRAVLSECPTAEEIEAMLTPLGLDIKDFYAIYGEQKINQAILYAKDLKDRYTVLWMNYDLQDEDNNYEY